MSGTRLRRWSEFDMGLLLEANDVLAGVIDPEPVDDVVKRHEKYLQSWEEGGHADKSGVRMFAVLDDHDAVGGIGRWPIDRDSVFAVEAGWFVLPRAENPWVATRAVHLIIDETARATPPGCYSYAFPSVEDEPSNTVCAQNDFTLMAQDTFTFQSHSLSVNVWKRLLTSRLIRVRTSTRDPIRTSTLSNEKAMPQR